MSASVVVSTTRTYFFSLLESIENVLTTALGVVDSRHETVITPAVPLMFVTVDGFAKLLAAECCNVAVNTLFVALAVPQ